MNGKKNPEPGRDDQLPPVPEGELSQAVYQRLRSLAHAQMSHERAGVTIQATALVHETYLRLLKDPTVNWDDDREFFAVAGACMRRVLVDEARRRGALKRGGQRQRLALTDVPDEPTPDLMETSVLVLDKALTALQGIDTRLYEVVMLRYFAGQSVDRTASILGVAPRTVKRDWATARHWLRTQIVGARDTAC